MTELDILLSEKELTTGPTLWLAPFGRRTPFGGGEGGDRLRLSPSSTGEHRGKRSIHALKSYQER